MDNSQYHPPQTEHSAELYKQVEQSTIKNSPERLSAPFEIVEQIQTLVDSFRDTAVAIEQANGREVKVRLFPVSFVRPARSGADIRKELLDKERVIGGQLFSEKNRYYFWYGGKNEVASQDGVADWYIQEIDPNNPESTSITHIETHPHYIKKFNHAGQLVPVSLSDLEIFIPAVYHYVHAIMDIYPFEKDRAEVILDGLEIPDDIAALQPPSHTTYQKSEYGLAA